MAAAEKPRAPLRRIPASPSRHLLSIRCPSLKGLDKYTGTVATGSPGQLEGHGDAAAWESAFLAFVLRQRAPAAPRLPSSPPLRNTSGAWPRQPGLAVCGRGPECSVPEARGCPPHCTVHTGRRVCPPGPWGPLPGRATAPAPGDTRGARAPCVSPSFAGQSGARRPSLGTVANSTSRLAGGRGRVYNLSPQIYRELTRCE